MGRTDNNSSFAAREGSFLLAKYAYMLVSGQKFKGFLYCHYKHNTYTALPEAYKPDALSADS